LSDQQSIAKVIPFSFTQDTLAVNPHYSEAAIGERFAYLLEELPKHQ